MFKVMMLREVIHKHSYMKFTTIAFIHHPAAVLHKLYTWGKGRNYVSTLSQCNLTSEATVKLIPNFRHKLTDDWCVKFDKTVCLLNCYSINFHRTWNAKKCDDFITALSLTFAFNSSYARNDIITSNRYTYLL